MSRAVPGPVARLLRDRLRCVAVVLLATTVLLTALVQAGAAAALARELDAGWRGAYDILVTSTGASAGEDAVSAPSADGAPTFFPPNSLGTDPLDGLTLDDVAAIRALTGVEVAAPIAQLAVPLSAQANLQVAYPVAVGSTTANPQAYGATMRLFTDDGLGERLVAEQRLAIVVDDADLPPTRECDDPGCVTERLPALVSDGVFTTQSPPDVADGFLRFVVQRPPRVTTTLTLVDPQAERALLGPAGGFLAPLTELPAQATARSVGEWAADRDGSTRADDVRRWVDEWTASLAAQEPGLADAVEVPAAPVVPVIVATRPTGTLRLEMDVESYGPVAAPPGDDGFTPVGSAPREVFSPGTGESVGTTSIDVSAFLDPFAREEIVIPWPGTPSDLTLTAMRSQAFPPTAQPGVALGAPRWAVDDDGVFALDTDTFASVTLSPVVDSDGPRIPVAPDGLGLGAESAYVTLGENAPGDLDGVDEWPLLVPVGDFSPSDLDEHTSALSYVPLGGFDPVGSAVVVGPDGAEIEPVSLLPSASGLGLVNQATTMVASFASATALTGNLPVAAVRVRVAGIDTYDDEAVARVLAVRDELHALGYAATVVAGASPSAVRVRVDDYAFGTLDAAGAQTVGTLGFVEQQWSELGAAARTDAAVSGATGVALVVGLAAAAVLLGAAELVAVPRRRREAAVLTMIGWQRRRVAAWVAAEEAVVLAVLVAAGVAAVSLGADHALTARGAGAALGVAAALATVAVAASMPGRRGRRRSTPVAVESGRATTGRGVSLRMTSVGRFGLRQALLHPAIGITTLLTTAATGLAVTVLGALVVEERHAGGASRIAEAITDRVFVTRLGFAAVAALAGVALGLLARRLDASIRADQHEVLRAMGWTRADRRHAQRVEALAVVVPAVLVVGTACWFVAIAVLPHGAATAAGPLTAAGAGTALLGGLLTLLPGSDHGPRDGAAS